MQDSNFLSSPESDQFDGPFQGNLSTPRLRRKRSAANAALTCRPSALTLGKLVPSLETCVLLHTTTTTTSSNADDRRLVHALFEPNFYVDGVKKRIEKLDRCTFERVKASVEELRILRWIARTGRIQQPNGLPAPERSLTQLYESIISNCNSHNISPEHFSSPDRLFDLISPLSGSNQPNTTKDNDSNESRSVSTLFIQPRPYTAIPASSAFELMEFEIRGVGDGILNSHRWSTLPDQVKRILEQVEFLSQQRNDLTSTLDEISLGEPSETQIEAEQVCHQILDLVRNRWRP